MADRMDPIRRALDAIIRTTEDALREADDEPQHVREAAFGWSAGIEQIERLQSILAQRAIEKAARAIELLADDARRELKARADARRTDAP